MWWQENIEISFEFSLHPILGAFGELTVMLGLFSLGYWMFPESPWNPQKMWFLEFDLPGAQCRRHTRNPEKPRTAKLDLGRKKLRFLHRFWCFWDEQQLTHDMAMDDPLQGMPAPIHWFFAVKKSQVTNEELANKADLGSWFGASISKHLDRMTMGQWVFFFAVFCQLNLSCVRPQGWFKVDEELRGKGSRYVKIADAVCFQHGQGFSGIEPGPGSTCQICSQVDLKGSKPDLILQGCKHHLTSVRRKMLVCIAWYRLKVDRVEMRVNNVRNAVRRDFWKLRIADNSF